MLETDQEFEGQPWPHQPGPRAVRMRVREPEAGIGADTGLMLVLHCWGGKYDDDLYLGWCETFSERFDVVTASINYLQSRDGEPTVAGEKPYDHGYLQAMDAIRGVYHLRQQLTGVRVGANPRRCYCMGVSGGGQCDSAGEQAGPAHLRLRGGPLRDARPHRRDRLRHR